MSSAERFEAMFRSHYRDVLRYAQRRTDPAEAEEVAGDTFVVAWSKLHQIPDPALPWLYAVARKCLANRQRAAGRRAGMRVGERVGRDPAEELAERDVILRAFAALGERDREALRLVAWEGLSLADAALAAGTSRAAFAMRLHRARRRLAAGLEAPEVHLFQETS